MENRRRKRIWIIAAAVVAIAAAGAGIWYIVSGRNSGSAVYVMPVSSVSQFGSGSSARYSGVVEPQEAVEFRKDSSKTVRETYVQEGDTVKAGDKLFSYDMDSVKLQISQKELDIRREQASITSNNELIAITEDSLERQRLRNQNLQTEYRIKALRNELNSLEASLGNTDVICPVDGTVKSVSDGTEGSDVYITVMKAGDFVVKGKISELNIAQFPQGTPVTVRSRIDDRTWQGTVSRIDTGQTAQDENGGYYIGGQESDKGSRYYFYVELQDSTGLFLGQHVIMEPAGARTGLWLFGDYIVGAGGSDPYVWAENNGRIRKKHLVLGEYAEDTGSWQVLEGLTVSDWIAYPDGTISDGMKTTTEYSYEEEGTWIDDGGEGFAEFIPEPEEVPEEDWSAEDEGAGE